MLDNQDFWIDLWLIHLHLNSMVIWLGLLNYQECGLMDLWINLWERLVGYVLQHELRVCHVLRSGKVLYQVFIAAFTCSPAERLHSTGQHHDLQHRGCHVSNNAGSVFK